LAALTDKLADALAPADKAVCTYILDTNAEITGIAVRREGEDIVWRKQ
jgi:hypothetical protein